MILQGGGRSPEGRWRRRNPQAGWRQDHKRRLNGGCGGGRGLAPAKLKKACGDLGCQRCVSSSVLPLQQCLLGLASKAAMVAGEYSCTRCTSTRCGNAAISLLFQNQCCLLRPLSLLTVEQQAMRVTVTHTNGR